MRRYCYQSMLRPEQIRARLEALTKPADSFGWRVSDSAAFRSHFYDRRHFFLIKTRPGKYGGGSINQPVFLGTLSEKAGETQIIGRFGWDRVRLIFYAVLLIPLLLPLKSLTMCILASVVYFLFLVLFTLLSSSIYCQEEEEVLSFIEQNLLS